MDTNFDRLLHRKDIRVVKRLIKKIVRPTSCAKTFDIYCDLDGDSKVTLKEWTLCLGIINTPVFTSATTTTTKRIRQHGNIEDILTSSSNHGSFENYYQNFYIKNADTARLLDYQVQENVENSKNNDNFESDLGHESFLKETEASALDCFTERQMALELDKLDPEGHVFIPSCLATGQYAPAQCHTSTGYCWCVDDVTGRRIPGTSTHNVMPDCDVSSQRSPRRHPDEGTKFWRSQCLHRNSIHRNWLFMLLALKYVYFSFHVYFVLIPK